MGSGSANRCGRGHAQPRRQRGAGRWGVGEQRDGTRIAPGRGAAPCVCAAFVHCCVPLHARTMQILGPYRAQPVQARGLSSGNACCCGSSMRVDVTAEALLRRRQTVDPQAAPAAAHHHLHGCAVARVTARRHSTLLRRARPDGVRTAAPQWLWRWHGPSFTTIQTAAGRALSRGRSETRRPTPSGEPAASGKLPRTRCQALPEG